MPLLGLGVYLVPDGEETENAVRWALEAGYRHIDTAQGYRNEASVGRALRDSGVPRGDVFVTTKFHPGRDDPLAELELSLERLGLDAVDLYIVHWPQGGPTWAWPGMERARERGLARSIGVSNFSAEELEAVLATGEVPPAVNQVKFNPFYFRRALLEACERHGVALEAWGSLTQGRDIRHPEIAAVAERVGRTPAQVLLRWAVQRGVPVIPKSVHRERIVENARVFDFSLDDDAMATLDGLDRTAGTAAALENPWWTPPGRGRGVAGRVLRSLRS